MLLIALALDLAALIGLCLWRPEPEPKPKPVCLMSPAELWEFFAGLDADGSGYIAVAVRHTDPTLVRQRYS